MQLRTVLVLALLAVPAAASSVSVSSSARLWLKSHGQPSGDELAELNKENPEAYALVKALLTKRSLGLLDPTHPSASFSTQKHEAVQGPEAFEALASPSELAAHRPLSAVATQVSMPYADVAPAAHHDWMNWKPAAAAMDDDAMVQNVLGAVAELKGGKKPALLSQHRAADESALSADEDIFTPDTKPAPVVEQPKAAPKAKASGYMDFSIMTGGDAPVEEKPVAVAAPAKKENSYLAGLNLSGDEPATPSLRKVKHSAPAAGNALESFSWDDDKPAQPKISMPKVEANGKSSNLLAWLGVVKKAPAPQVQAAAKPVNPYILDLSD